MARSPPSECTEPGCALLVPYGKGTKCPLHTKQKLNSYRKSPERQQYEAFYSSALWRAISKDFRRRHPLCVACTQQGIVRPAAVVDHIVELRDDWSRRVELKNLQALCHACHNLKTSRAKQVRAHTQR